MLNKKLKLCAATETFATIITIKCLRALQNPKRLSLYAQGVKKSNWASISSCTGTCHKKAPLCGINVKLDESFTLSLLQRQAIYT